MSKAELLEIKIKKTIDTQFELLNESEPDGYYWRGESRDYNFIGLKVENILKSVNGTRRKILDIGCGYGALVSKLFREGEEAYGITGTEYNKNPDCKNIFVRDAHFLTKIPEFAKLVGKFNVIICQHTAYHLVHLSLALIEAYTMLETGGLIILDSLEFKGLYNYQYIDLFQYLRRQGYKLITFPEGELFSHNTVFILQKTKENPVLNLPLIPVSIIRSRVHYSLQLPDSKRSISPCPIPNFIIEPIRNALMRLNLMEIEEHHQWCFPFIIKAVMPLIPYSIFAVRQTLYDDARRYDDTLITKGPPLDPKYYVLSSFFECYSYNRFIYNQKKSKFDLINRYFINYLIIMVHRDIKFHIEFAEFREQLKSVGLSIPEIEYFEKMDNAVRSSVLMGQSYSECLKEFLNGYNEAFQMRLVMQSLVLDHHAIYCSKLLRQPPSLWVRLGENQQPLAQMLKKKSSVINFSTFFEGTQCVSESEFKLNNKLKKLLDSIFNLTLEEKFSQYVVENKDSSRKFLNQEDLKKIPKRIMEEMLLDKGHNSKVIVHLYVLGFACYQFNLCRDINTFMKDNHFKFSAENFSEVTIQCGEEQIASYFGNHAASFQALTHSGISMLSSSSTSTSTTSQLSVKPVSYDLL